MKTNLDFMKTHENFEKEGVWFEISETIAFKIKRTGTANKEYMKAMSLAMKPYTRRIQMGEMDFNKNQEITKNVFIKTCFVDWRGIIVDEKELPFSIDAALDLFNDKGFRDLIDRLADFASDPASYKNEADGEDLGNS